VELRKSGAGQLRNVAELFDNALFGVAGGGNLMSLYENYKVLIKHMLLVFIVI
jgi:hypothetical protein